MVLLVENVSLIKYNISNSFPPHVLHLLYYGTVMEHKKSTKSCSIINSFTHFFNSFFHL